MAKIHQISFQVSLKDGFKSTTKEPLKTVRRSNILDKMMKPAGGSDSPPAQTPSRGSPTPAAAPVVHAPKPEPVVHSPAPAPAPVSKPAPPQNEVKPTPAPAAAAEPVNQRQSANLTNTPSSNNVPAGTPSLPPVSITLLKQSIFQQIPNISMLVPQLLK